MHVFFHACSVLMFLIIIAISIHSIIILGSKMPEAPNGAFSHGAIVGGIWDQTVLVSGNGCVWDLIFVGKTWEKLPKCHGLTPGQLVFFDPSSYLKLQYWCIPHFNTKPCIIRMVNKCKIPVRDSFSAIPIGAYHGISLQKRKNKLVK